jgi:enoyl-CoA hydratase/carnithine racemase
VGDPRQLQSERSGSVLVLQLDNPGARNGITVTMADALLEELTRAGSDDAIGAVVLTGVGGHFCSGADLTSFMSQAKDPGPEGRRGLVDALLVRRLHPALLAIWNCPKPTVGALAGASVGFGLSLALACDLRVMATDAYFTSGFLKRGIFPDGGLPYQLERLAGLGRAMELMLCPDRRLTSAEAREWGLATRVAAPESLQSEALSLARELAAGPRHVQRDAKTMLRAPWHALEQVLAAEVRPAQDAFGGEDVVEGLAAFFERRPPNFTRSKR